MNKMKISTYIFTALFTLFMTGLASAQVAVMHTNPKSIFDVEASNPAAPASTDGLLIPRVNALPATNPGADQDGMLIFLTTPTTEYKKGHYYWDNTITKWTFFGAEWSDGYNDNLTDLTYLKQAYAKNDQDVVILDNGRLGMGTDDPQESIEIRLPGDNDIQIGSVNPPNAPNIIFYTKEGTHAAPDYLNNNDPIYALSGKVWTGSGKSGIVANISAVADGNHSSGNLPTKYNFDVTASGDDSADDSGVEMTLKESGKLGIGTETPTAILEIKAGTATANSAPIKFTSGTNLSSPEAGAIEYDGTNLYFTPNTTRKTILTKLSNTATINFPSITSNNSSEQTVTVPGATTNGTCSCTPFGSIENGLKWSCYVSAANTVTIRLSNVASGSINPASKTWRATVIE